MIKLLLPVLALCVAAPAMAEIYRWTDENGQVHYGERPPQDKAERIDLPQGPVSSPTPAADEAERRVRRQRMLDAFSHKREQKKAQKAREREERQRLAKECEQVKRYWSDLNYGGPVYYEGPDGGRRYLDDAERAAELDKLRPAYRKTCGEEPR